MNLTNKKILIIFPHPDDETAFTGGLIQRANRVGAEVTYICLTNGEASTLKSGLNENEDLGKAREIEMSKVAHYLGFKLIMAGYPDGGIKANMKAIKEYIKMRIFSTKPDIIITFEPHGVYGHPDHIACYEMMSEIYNEYGKTFQLVYATVSETFVANKGAQGMAKDYNEINPIRANWKLKLNPAEVITKYKAFQMHKTQSDVKRSIHDKLQGLKLLLNEYFYIVDLKQESKQR